MMRTPRRASPAAFYPELILFSNVPPPVLSWVQIFPQRSTVQNNRLYIIKWVKWENTSCLKMGCWPLTVSTYRCGIYSRLTHFNTERIEKDSMSIKRTWDETMSPQWRYLHQQESARKRGGRKTAARLRREEEEKNTPTSETKYERINSELKKEKVKYDIKATRLSTESKEQE